jgi:signal transduction histidine kinase
LETETAVQDEHVHCDQAGNPRNVLVHAYPLRDQGGEITAIIEYTMDVTGHVQAKEMLMRSERFAAVGKLAAAVAHEIKNPLQSVLGCLGLAEEALADGRDPAKYFAVARDAVRRVSRTVGQMRELYRPMTAQKEPVAVNALLRRLLTLVEPQGESNEVTLRLNPAPDLPPVMAVADQLDQVFLNLLLNGIEAMPEGGELVVTTRLTETPPGVAVSVADEGVGIPALDLPHVFDPFFTTKYDGSGLGLAVSFGIIDQHGGWIDVESEAGVGSTFTVWTPVS